MNTYKNSNNFSKIDYMHIPDEVFKIDYKGYSFKQIFKLFQKIKIIKTLDTFLKMYNSLLKNQNI